MAAAGERAPASQVDHAGGACGEEFDDSCQGNLVVAMQASDGQRESGFESGDSEQGALELDNLFVRRMGGVIGRDGIDSAIGKRNQNRLAVGARTPTVKRFSLP